jgi:hypothetical protein
VYFIMFQSTRPRGARRGASSFGSYVTAFQSTRPRGARLARYHDVRIEAGVSIHAPAWGATSAESLALGLLPRFNPRARVGRDAIFAWL